MSDFAAVTSPDEISRILKIAQADQAEIHCEVSRGKSIALEIRGLHDSNLVLGLKKVSGGGAPLLSSAFPGGLSAGVPMEIVISLVDGQYAIRDVVTDVSMTTFTLNAGRSLLKLQRRSDFRVGVRVDDLRFATKIDGSDVKLLLLDLSAGGMRVLWPLSLGPAKEGDVLTGRLSLSLKPERGTGAEKFADVSALIVRDHGVESAVRPQDGHAVSFKFQNLSLDDARTILFACLSVHRSRYGSR
ncbi:MAG: PilZ domain-containing protein [Bdellovibrionales bacterium]|nr:PilZ domain-containing protein [Bdellovibrionales bacterium]